MHSGVDLSQMSSRQLLHLYADILTTLTERQVIRSRNAPAGDLAEWLVAKAYSGDLAPPSEKSWDVLAAGGRKLQVKVRLIAPGDRRSHSFSPFRSFDFDACVFVVMDAHSYEVIRAHEVPTAGVQGVAREAAWVRGHRVGTKDLLATISGAVDVTESLRRAMAALGDPPSARYPADLGGAQG